MTIKFIIKIWYQFVKIFDEFFYDDVISHIYDQKKDLKLKVKPLGWLWWNFRTF